MLFNKKDFDSKQRFSIRKLSVGVCSVLLSTLFLTFNEGQTAHASTENTTHDETVTNVTAGLNNDNTKDSTDESSLPSTEKHAPIPVAQSVNNKATEEVEQTSEQSNSKKQNVNQSQKEDSYTTPQDTQLVSVTSNIASTDKNVDSTTNKTISLDLSKITNKALATQALSEPKAATENIAPVVYTVDEGAAANAGSTLNEQDAARFIQNASALEAAGAKITWDGTPDTGTAAGGVAGGMGSGKIKITYADGQVITEDVQFLLNPQVGLHQGQAFFYVKNVGDNVTSFDETDANGHVLYDSNNLANSIISPGMGFAAADPTGVSVRLNSPIDTSEEGIHWAEFLVTDASTTQTAFGNTVGTYTIKVPYIVKGLKLRTDIPTDGKGDPVINAQGLTYPTGTNTTMLPSINTDQIGFDPTIAPATLGQYFYQDYALAYSLGVTTTVSDWTQLANHFTMSLAGLPNSAGQNVQVNYVAMPKLDDFYFYNQGPNPNATYAVNRVANQNYLQNTLGNNGLDWHAKTGSYSSTAIFHVDNPNWLAMDGGVNSGKWTLTVNASFSQTNSSNQPEIFSNGSFNASSGTKEFIDQVKQYTTDFFQNIGTGNTVNVPEMNPTTYYALRGKAIALYPAVAKDADPVDVSDGPVDVAKAIQDSIENPLNKASSNPILNGNTTWPAGTKFKWLDKDNNPLAITIDKAGQTYQGNVEVTLPSGTSTIVKDVTITTKAKVKVKSETVDYGTKLSAADLVTNGSAFPKGTTFQFVDNSEPNWNKPGSYNDVKITATYPLSTTDASGNTTPVKDANGKVKTTTTDVATAAVAINDARVINVLKGSTAPDLDAILNLPSDWEEHTASWTTDINTDSTNQGLITIYYPASKLNQEIKVYVNVIPQLIAVDGKEFKTDGTSFAGKGGSLANGDNQGANLTSNNGTAINYQAYSKEGDVGQQSTYPEKETSYQPIFSVSGLQTNTDGSLVSGEQTATIRVSVPDGTLGAEKDASGLYYTITAKVVVAQPVTFEFVDDDENNKVLSTQTQEFIKGQEATISPSLIIPDNYELAAGQTLPTTYTLAHYSPNNPVVQIHLNHKTEDITDTDPQAQETRTVTVNYLAAADGNGYQKGDKVFDSAVLDVYYTRKATKDLVTGDVTYGPWLWNTSKGDSSTPGYHVVSGEWTVPSSWGAVTVKVPTVDGFTAITTGDWETNKDGTQSQAPANEFVYPTYDGTLNTVDDSNSIAYTDASPVYEGLATHTVYFAPDEQFSRTITAEYKYFENGQAGDDVFPPATLTLNFTRKASAYSEKTGNITYSGNYDLHFSNSSAPTGSSWGSATDSTNNAIPGQSASISVPVPTKDGYTAVTDPADPYSNNARYVAAPSTIYSYSELYTNQNDSSWFYRPSRTIYYVKNSELSKTITRTINITEPGQTTKTTTQTATITRKPILNNDDTSVIFGNWGTDANNWTAVDVPAHDGYNVSITQTVNGQTTVLDSIPAETVDGKTQDTVINVTYGAVATAQLTGNGSSTYNGQPITVNNLNNAATGLKIVVTGPTANAGSLSLNAGDVEFSADGQTWTTDMPTDAKTYQVRLTTQGENAIKNRYGNNSIIWTQDGKSTITSDATYTINPLSIDSVLHGNDRKTYDGTDGVINPSGYEFKTGKNVNGQLVDLNAAGLTAADFEWTNDQGLALDSTPKNVGTYYIKLKDTGFSKLQKQNPNFTLTNTGLVKYVITPAQASATLSGSGKRAYNGQSVSVDDLNKQDANNNITLTLHYPKDGNSNYSTTVALTAANFTWNTPNGDAPVNANSEAYTISLKPAAIKAIIENATGTGQNDLANVVVAPDAISGTASYTITPLVSTATLSNVGNYGKTYDAQVTNQIDPAKLQIATTVNGQTESLNTTGLTGSDYEWVDASGDVLSQDNYPKNVGTYFIRLNDNGLAKLQANNPNFTLTVDGQGSYVISQAEGLAVLSGTNSKVYDGQVISTAKVNSNGQIVVQLHFPGASADATYTLQDGDYTFSESNPTDVGSYRIVLTDAGKTNIAKRVEELSGTGQNNQANATVAESAISGNATFTITPSNNVAKVSGTQTETYNGQAINVVYNADGTNSVTVSFSSTNNGAVLSGIQLNSDDFETVDNAGNTTTAQNAGTYRVVLTAAGIDKIQTAAGKNYQVSQDPEAYGQLGINKAQASAVFKGDAVYTYTGSTNTDYLNAFSIELNEPNNPTYQLVAGDIEFKVGDNWTTEAPLNVGKYEVRLSQAGWNHIKAINNDNISWSATASAGEGSYTINPATATTELSGHGSMVYNGSQVTTDDLYANGSSIMVIISGDQIANLPTSFRLEDGDYSWNTTNGAVPKDVGNYTISLTEQGLDKIQTLINNAVGTGNVNLTRTNTGSATFEIKQAVSPNVQLDGAEKSKYNGQPVSFDPTNDETRKNFVFNNVDGLTVPALTSNDFEWVDKDGNPLPNGAPVNVGYYYLQLNADGKEAFAKANPNYTFVKDGNSTITGRITYHIYPAELIIGVTGSASQVYNGQNAVIKQEQLDRGDIKLVWDNSNSQPTDLGKFTLMPADLEVVNADGQPVKAANYNADKQFGPDYHVQLTSAAIEKIKALTGANNYDISQKASTAQYIIYTHKAELTLTGNQTTTYGTVLPFNPAAYSADLSNWNDEVTPKPVIGKLQAGDVYIEGYENGSLPTNVGSYKVVIAQQLIDRLKKEYPDYDFEGTFGNGRSADDIIDAEHDPASYVITPADTTVTIDGAQKVKYGESTDIQYGGNNGYKIIITAPVHNADVNNDQERIYQDVQLTTGDLEFVTDPSNVGTYEVKLSEQGIRKLQSLTGSTNYDWTQASLARANFFVDQMPITITVSGTQSVDYGSAEWLEAIKNNPQGFALSVKTENGTTLTYPVQTGDLVFKQTPGNVGSYDVQLSSDGLAHIAAALGTNYEYPSNASSINSYGTFTVNKGKATISLQGNDQTTYTGSLITPINFKNGKYTYLATIYTADGNVAKTVALLASDLQFVDGNPTNVGNYQVELSAEGKNKLEALDGNNGNNYDWTFNSTATFHIDHATAQANLLGSNQKTFDGTRITIAQVNNGGDIIVKLNYPGSSADSTYQLQSGDFVWNTQDGQAPISVGTYTLSLTKDGLANLQAVIDAAAGENNVVISANGLAGSATFTITPKELTNVTISSNDQEKTYNGQAANLDVKDLTISGNGTIANVPLSDEGITVSDFDWYDSTGKKLESIPTQAGQYQARLKDSALKTLQDNNPNYYFSAVQGTVKYTIKQTAATETLSGTGSKTYDAQGVTAASVLDKLIWTPSGLVAGQSLDLSNLGADDYEWFTKSADGTYTLMTGLPTNVGTYYLKIKSGSDAKIKAANPNYSFAENAINGEFTYVINQATGSAKLAGQNDKTYDGQSVTTAEVNSPSGNIEITFTFPGDNNSSYQLKNGDYDWYDAKGKKLETAPTNVGTYTIKINPDRLQDIINSVAGTGNVKIDDDTGVATFIINKRDLSVVLGEKTGVNAGKIYDGQASVINPADGVFTTTGLVSSESLNIDKLSVSDYEWQDAAGNVLTAAPINVGTYYISLNNKGLEQLQADNPNYNISESGRFEYVVSPAQAAITVSGSQESPQALINPDSFKVTPSTGITVPAGLTYEFVGTPDQAGIYDINLTPESIQKLKDANPNYALEISSTAKFTLDATLTITFEDTNEGNKQVGGEITKTGADGTTISDLGLKIPENYELAPNQELPTSYQFGKDLNQSLIIKLVHGTESVDPTKPDTNPDPTDKNWFKDKGLIKAVTRSINYKGLSAEQLSQIPNDQKGEQTVEFTRTATYDKVTHELVAGSEGKWTAVNSEDKFIGFTPKEFAGYTANKTVPTVEVNADDKNSSITITYTANPQSISYKFVDDDKDGAEVGTVTFAGVTDQTINPNLVVPAHYELAKGQVLPTTYTFKATGNNPIEIHLVEKVSPLDPEHIPDGTKNPENHDQPVTKADFTKTIKRTVNVIYPVSYTGDKPNLNQSVILKRTGSYNEVTGIVTWDAWNTDEFTEESVPVIAGYTVSQATIPAMQVTALTPDQTVNITYAPKSQSGKISYIDSNGKEISSTPLTGKTDEPVNITIAVPAGWKLVPGQDIPKTVTATSDGVPTITIRIEHDTITVDPTDPKSSKVPTGPVPGNPDKTYEPIDQSRDLEKTIIRTITVIKPDGTKNSFVQEVKFTRTAVFDMVTGEATFGTWTVNGTAQWPAYTAPDIVGYTADNSAVAETVTSETANSNVTISYTANKQNGKISYVDLNGKEIGSTPLSGKTGETISVIPQAPAGWKIVSGENIPKTIKIEANGLPTIVVKVKHNVIVVTPDTPAKDIPQGKVPGQPDKTYPAIENLVSEPIRVIVVTNPDGTKQQITQTVRFRRIASFDEVTGEISYSNWQSIGEAVWSEYIPKAIAGYVASPANVAQQSVTPNMTNQIVQVGYIKLEKPVKPNNHPTPSNENKPNNQKPSLNHEFKNNNSVNKPNSISTHELKNHTSHVNSQGKVVDYVEARKKNVLPQTGIHQNSLMGIIGSLLSGISLFGLLGTRRKKKDDKK